MSIIFNRFYPIYSLHPTGFKTLNLLNLLSKKNVIFFAKNKDDVRVINEEVSSFQNYFCHVYQEDLGTRITSEKGHLIIVTNQEELEKAKEILSSLDFLTLKVGLEIRLQDLIQVFHNANFERRLIVESPGEFAVRGGIIDVFPQGHKKPIRIELRGNVIFSIRYFDEDTQRSVAKKDEVQLFGIKGASQRENFIELVVELEGNSPFLVEHNFNYLGNVDLLKEEIRSLKERGFKVYFFAHGKDKKEFFESLLGCEVVNGLIYNGFIFRDEKLAVFTESELRGIRHRKWIKREKAKERIEDYTSLEVGDLLVHLDYGIGKFIGLERINVEGVRYDTIKIEYKDGVVNVPVNNLYKVEKFVAEEGQEVEISALASPHWKIKRAKAIVETYKFAKELLTIHSLRKKKRGFVFKPYPEWEFKLYASFPYEETEGQIRVMEEIFGDMESDRIMDRLVAGEVGFGKTEIALRSAFRAVVNDFQVIILVPTTLLALQHYTNFVKRLRNFPVKVAMLSRLTHDKERSLIHEGLASGEVDIVIGTHALLRSNIEFKNPGLLIIDEEHRFGVEDKELIRKKFPLIDTLRLTATPIPRTLHMSLGKVYDLSILDTPPPGREAVETYVGIFDEELIKHAIDFELSRGGKVFFVNNRIRGLLEIVNFLEQMFPGLRIGYAHGRMQRTQLEDIYISFYLGSFDILVSTPIIEAGVDFPEANTIIVNNAHTFGLADLHQLRGRVGRGIKKGYAYFLTPKEISQEAKKRLSIIEKYSELGSGFKIAMKDLEVRGAGEILGKRQHGFVRTLGLEMFYRLLEEAILEIEGEKLHEVDVKIKTDAYIPLDYIEDENTRLSFYKKLADARTVEEIDELKFELEDRFGPIPKEVEELFYFQMVKIFASKNERIKSVTITPAELILEINGNFKRLKRGINFDLLSTLA
ncbi:MAG: DEAD/DEAH box helicase [candidate division WOR-3 bacterium]